MRKPAGGNKIGHAAIPPRRDQLEMTQKPCFRQLFWINPHGITS
jgi:hypothetical protein